MVFEADFVTYKSEILHKGFGYKCEQFVIGDIFGFTIYRDSLEEKIIYRIYKYYKKIFCIDFEFHISNGYYETNDYSLGNEQYFRGYCMDLLSKLYKKHKNK